MGEVYFFICMARCSEGYVHIIISKKRTIKSNNLYSHDKVPIKIRKREVTQNGIEKTDFVRDVYYADSRDVCLQCI